MDVTPKKEDISSFFEQSYNFDEFQFQDFLNFEDETVVRLARKSKQGKCLKCGAKGVAENFRTRRIRDLDLIKRCYIEFEQAKIRCKCGYRGVERLDFLGRHSMYTQRFEEFVGRLTEIMSLSDVAGICGINWKTAQKLNNSRKQTG